MTISTYLYVGAGALFLAFLVKLPAFFKARDDSLLRSICALLLVGSFDLVVVAPDTIAAINDATGVTNFAAPVAYSMVTAFSGASLVLVIRWRGGHPEQVRRFSRRCVIAYAVVITALIALFALGSTPDERLRDFDTYYANTPYIREMIVLYLWAHLVASAMTSALCRRWSKDVGGTLRAGLRILTAAYLLHVAYDLTKTTAVVARWAGVDWDDLSTYVAPQIVGPSPILVGVGFVLPLVGSRVTGTTHALRRLRQLEPLAREMGRFTSHSAVRTEIPRWTPALHLRLTHRETTIFDGLLELAPYSDPAVRDAAHRQALERGESEQHAATIAQAAMIVAAAEAKLADREPENGDPEVDEPTPVDHRTYDLVAIAQALTSPVVQDVRDHHRRALDESSQP